MGAISCGRDMTTTIETEPLALGSKVTGKCPICREVQAIIFHRGIREDPDCPVLRCIQCGTVYLEPRYHDLRAYYAEEYRKRHSNAVGKVLTPRQDFELMRPLLDRREMFFREYVPKGAKVLEIGSGNGAFLDRIRGDYEVKANEWNPDYAAFTRDELGIPTSEDDLDDAFPGELFTAVVAYQVVEHILDPIDWLRRIKKRLIGGGWVILETPNIDSALVSIFEIPEFRNFFFREAHLTYFNQTTLVNTMGVVGFESRCLLRQDYSLTNALHWLFLGEPQPDAAVARNTLQFVNPAHPASSIFGRFFVRIDREYRSMLDVLKACDYLTAVGRKREI